jgi:hypothetical protein
MTAEQSDPDEVWANTVDKGRFAVGVTRTGDHRGKLLVTVVATGEVLLDEEVGLAYDALFGPDVTDVAEWEGAALGTIDRWIDEQKG